MSDDQLLVTKALTGASLCLRCLTIKTGLTLPRADRVLREFATGVNPHPERGACAGCQRNRTTYRLHSWFHARARPTTTTERPDRVTTYMPDRVSIVTRLILDRPTCLDCIGTKSGMTVGEAEATFELISRALKPYREPDRCRVCDETKEVYSVHRLTP